MNCSDYSTAWVCRKCGSLISLGFEDVALGSDSIRAGLSQPGGQYCRVCRVAYEEKDDRERAALAHSQNGVAVDAIQPGVRVALPRGNVIGGVKGGGELDVVAVPYVFRYLCAELASMGIAVSLEVR